MIPRLVLARQAPGQPAYRDAADQAPTQQDIDSLVQLGMQGDLPGAQRHYAAELTIADRLAAQDPANSQWQRDLTFSQ